MKRPAIIFDMDGVLADTEPLKFRAHASALRAAGGDLTEALYRREMGRVHEGVVRAFLREAGLEAGHRAVEEYETHFRAAYRRHLSSDLTPCEGALAALDRCRREGRRLALVTSSEHWMAQLVLNGLNVRGHFEAVITADDVENEKPDPEPYRRALETLLGHPPGPAPAVAVEDTRAGVASATGAGLPVVAVRHDLNQDEPFDAAFAVVDSLAPAEELLALIDRAARGTGGPAGP